MISHEVVKLLESIVVRFSTDIKHKTVLRLKILANSLEEPFVRINFAIVPLLDAEHEINTSSFKDFRVNSKIPSCALKAMENISGDFIIFDVIVHNISHGLHLEIVVTIRVHEALLEQNFFVKETFLTCHEFETRRNTIVTINDDDDQEIIFGEIRLWVQFESVVVMNTTLECVSELALVFIVHSNTDGKLGVLFTDSASRPDL